MKIIVTLLLIFFFSQHPVQVGINSEPSFYTTTMILPVNQVQYITYVLPGESEVNKFTPVKLQLTDANYKQMLIKDREIIDYLLNNFGDLMSVDEIDKLNNYKEWIQKSLAGINPMTANDVVKMEYYILQVYNKICKTTQETRKNDLLILAKSYKLLKTHDTLPKLNTLKEQTLNDIKQTYYEILKWNYGCEYYYNYYHPKVFNLKDKAEKIVSYTYIYNEANQYYEIYKVLIDEKVVPKELENEWDEEIQPQYIDFLRGKSLDFDVNMMNNYIITVLETLRGDALNKLNDAYEYTIEFDRFPFIEKGRALKRIEVLQEKINSYNFNTTTLNPDTVREFVQDYKEAKNMKHTVKIMYVRDVLGLFIIMILSLYIFIVRTDIIFNIYNRRKY